MEDGSGTSMRNNLGPENVMLRLRKENSSSDSLVASMLGSCSNMGLQAVGSLDNSAVVGCGQKRPFYPCFEGSLNGEEAAGDEDGGDDCSHNNVEKKRRLTCDQVRSLEHNFELENKLEPERKMQLAKELGLQPRQVAVWFQNRRARWKTKQLERDYEVLFLDYNRLKAKLEAIVQEKEKLKSEIQRLSGKELHGCEAVEGNLGSGSETTTVHTSSQQQQAAHVNPMIPLKAAQIESEDQQQLDVQESKDSQWRASSTTVVDIPSTPMNQKEQTTSSDSNSSEILDTGSPRTIDSHNLSSMVQPTTTLEQETTITDCSATRGAFAAETTTFMDPPSLLQTADDLCTRDIILSPREEELFQRATIKLEDHDGNIDSHHDDHSCTYLLSQLDEKGGIPWWDWS